MAWTAKQLADAANVTGGYIRRLCRKGIIKADKFGRAWCIPDDEAKKYLAQQQAKEETPQP